MKNDSDLTNPERTLTCEVSIVVPMFNEAAAVSSSLQVIAKHVRGSTPDFEIVAVDDGSTDGTWDVVRAGGLHIAGLRGVRLSRNFGKEAALFAGLTHARGRAVIIMDADLQHPPELLPQFIELWRGGGVDVIDGIKRTPGGALSRRITSRLFNRLITSLTGYDFRGTSDYKLIDRKVLDALLEIGETRTFFRGLVEWTGFRHRTIDYDVAPRRSGSSRWTTPSLVRLAGRTVISYSALPLRLIHLSGLCFFAMAIVLALRSLWLYWQGAAPSGLTTIILLLLVVSSLTLLGLAVLSEYVAAIYEEVKGRPRFIVAERLDSRPGPLADAQNHVRPDRVSGRA
jgi:glycosyltransferase involved in cell wall biosynthesis